VIIPITDLVERHHIDLGTVLHLGAHLGEEAADYERAGARHVVWVEAAPDVFARLAVAVEPFGHRALQALISDRDGQEVDFHLSDNDGKSSSLLAMKTHLHVHPDVAVIGSTRLGTTTVDTLCAHHTIGPVDLLTMDLQGAELLALRGATETLRSVRFVYTEVNVDELYAGCAQLDEIDEQLVGFVRMETALTPHGWGDAFYVRAGEVAPGVELRSWTA
jgi:FkbM family methyltransferase